MKNKYPSYFYVQLDQIKIKFPHLAEKDQITITEIICKEKAEVMEKAIQDIKLIIVPYLEQNWLNHIKFLTEKIEDYNEK